MTEKIDNILPEQEDQTERILSLQELREAASKLGYTSQNVGKNIDNLLQLSRNHFRQPYQHPYESEDKSWYMDGAFGPVEIMRPAPEYNSRFNQGHEYNISGFERLRLETRQREVVPEGTERFAETDTGKFFFNIARSYFESAEKE